MCKKQRQDLSYTYVLFRQFPSFRIELPHICDTKCHCVKKISRNNFAKFVFMTFQLIV